MVLGSSLYLPMMSYADGLHSSLTFAREVGRLPDSCRASLAKAAHNWTTPLWVSTLMSDRADSPGPRRTRFSTIRGDHAVVTNRRALCFAVCLRNRERKRQAATAATHGLIDRCFHERTLS
jgi:hypothetical protein